MSNIREKKAFTKDQFWPSIKYWLAGLESQQSLSEHQRAINQWFDAFLRSDEANDPDIRGESLVQRDNILNLFVIMERYPQEVRDKKLRKYLAV